MTPRACEPCLRRAWLVGILAPYIELVATGEPGSRSPELLKLDDRALTEAVAKRRADRLLARAAAIPLAEMEAAVESAGCFACCRCDPSYPERLGLSADAPAVLFGLGQGEALGSLGDVGAITVVGSRRASGYGREVAQSLAAELAGAGFTVISGMAYGIDAAAHRGALERGRTVAVLGCGADVIYPRRHRRLHAEIAERGLVLSELPPGTGAWRWTFPARNRIMAAVAAMTVVVEAAHRSGSLITSDLANQADREVGAVPGPVTSSLSAGTNALLAEGARVVRDAQDVIDILLGPGALQVRGVGPPLEPELAQVLARVGEGIVEPDAWAVALGGDASAAGVALAQLELLGYLTADSRGRYRRTALQPPGEGAGN